MTDEQIFELAETHGWQDDFGRWNFKDDGLLDFVYMLQEHMKQEGWRECAKGQRTTQYCGIAEQARAEEREACAWVCDDLAAKDKLSNYYAIAAKAIRANRSQTATSVFISNRTTQVTTQVTGEVTGEVDAVNMSQERVDETAKCEQEKNV